MAVEKHGPNSWVSVANSVNRPTKDCRQQYYKITKSRVEWSLVSDVQLIVGQKMFAD